jgi:hypothetical protein
MNAIIEYHDSQLPKGEFLLAREGPRIGLFIMHVYIVNIMALIVDFVSHTTFL